MNKKIECADLGVKNCDFSASGETAGDVVRQVVDHLRKQHDIDMPDADVILQGEQIEDPLEVTEPPVALIVDRLRDDLNIEPPEGPEMPKPSIGRTPSR